VTLQCRYPTKRAFRTREEARQGAALIRQRVEEQGGWYNPLYPYRCPAVHGEKHWHLSRSRQGTKTCRSCGERRPAWFDSRRQEWVVYAHENCATQAVSA